MKKITNQSEFDAAFQGGERAFEIVGSPDLVVSEGEPLLVAWGSSSPRVVAWESSSPRVEAWGSSSPRVVARESSSPRVEARESSSPRCVWDSNYTMPEQGWDRFDIEAYQADGGEMREFLTGGGKTLEEVCSPEHWSCHNWTNCPTAAAYGVNDIESLPPDRQWQATTFIALFDAKRLRNPLEQARATLEGAPQ